MLLICDKILYKDISPTMPSCGNGVHNRTRAKSRNPKNFSGKTTKGEKEDEHFKEKAKGYPFGYCGCSRVSASRIGFGSARNCGRT